MHGCSGGACVVAPGGKADACCLANAFALGGHMCGCSGGAKWLLWGGHVCMVAPGGGIVSGK